MSLFEGQVVVVTGASRGIGEATARRFAAEGARVVLAARSEKRMLRLADRIHEAGGEALAVACDVRDFTEVSRLYDLTVERFGAPDAVINNAGTIQPIDLLADSDADEWSAAIDTNLKGVYYNLRCAIPLMLASGGGTVVNISSGAATGAIEGWSHYCAAKAGVLNLTRCAHLEYGGEGIRVVGLSPGTVETRMQEEIRGSGIDNRVARLDPSDHIPPEWVAQAIIYLCGDGAGRHGGTDFSLKTDEGRAEAGLPPASG